MTDPSVLLTSMPFGALERPSLGLGLLQAGVERAGYRCSAQYLGFELANRIGVDTYRWIYNLPYEAFVGEWLFTDSLHGPNQESDREFLFGELRDRWHLDDHDLLRLVRAKNTCTSFIEEVAESIDWTRYSVIGFSSTFHQNIASLALADRVRKCAPDSLICFGGANWEGVMGSALLNEFEFVDVCFSGEADDSFPAMLDAVRHSRPFTEVPGIAYRGSNGVVEVNETCADLADLDGLVIPEFSPFFDGLSKLDDADEIAPVLLLETARGCWWGARSHCTFCGLNGASMAFRSKSPERVLDEIGVLTREYGVMTFAVVDNILDMRYFRSVLPELCEREERLTLFWEVKANLSRTQVRALACAGVERVQPGIESMSDRILSLMRKGTTRFRNVALLKWCKEYGVTPEWNFLYGFPGERFEDYNEMADLFMKIRHLTPPSGQGSVRLDRFSPYHSDPGAFGMVNVRPTRPYRFLYPGAGDNLDEMSYYFDFDYEDGHVPQECAEPALAALRLWKETHESCDLWLVENRSGGIVIIDDRAATRRTAIVDGWKSSVYLECDRARTRDHLQELDLSVGVPRDELDRYLDRCVDTGLMITDGDSFLSLAVHVPSRDGEFEAVRRIPVGVAGSP